MPLEPQSVNPRDLTTAMQTAVSSQIGTIVYFLQFNFYNTETELEDIQYFTTAPHNIVTTSAIPFASLPLATYTWVGIGGNLGFQTVQESTDLAGNGVDITLGGVLSSTITLILGKSYLGRFVRIWLGKLNTNGTLLLDPLLVFYGRMNGGFEVEEKRERDGVGTVDIICRATDRLGDLNIVKGIQTNVESHQKYYPEDEFFSFVQSLMGKVVYWSVRGED